MLYAGPEDLQAFKNRMQSYVHPFVQTVIDSIIVLQQIDGLANFKENHIALLKQFIAIVTKEKNLYTNATITLPLGSEDNVLRAQIQNITAQESDSAPLYNPLYYLLHNCRFNKSKGRVQDNDYQASFSARFSDLLLREQDIEACVLEMLSEEAIEEIVNNYQDEEYALENPSTNNNNQKPKSLKRKRDQHEEQPSSPNTEFREQNLKEQRKILTQFEQEKADRELAIKSAPIAEQNLLLTQFESQKRQEAADNAFALQLQAAEQMSVTQQEQADRKLAQQLQNQFSANQRRF